MLCLGEIRVLPLRYDFLRVFCFPFLSVMLKVSLGLGCMSLKVSLWEQLI